MAVPPAAPPSRRRPRAAPPAVSAAAGPPAAEVAHALEAHYAAHGRELPWRRTRDPYAIWVSETMLQQTRVETVVPYYERFLQRFPDVASLAAAPLESVLKAWENLGYYSRARNLWRGAAHVVAHCGGQLPATAAALRAVPGIGEYTAGAIASIAFAERVPAVDGNVRRVLARVYAIAACVDAPAGQRAVVARATALVLAAGEPGRLNQAVMDLGATVCTPRRPRCPACPLAGPCRALQSGSVAAVPVRRRAGPVPHRPAVAVRIADDAGRWLLVQRPARGLLGGLWAFPAGAPLGPAEPPWATLARTVEAVLGLVLAAPRPAGSVRHAYTHFRTTVAVFDAVLAAPTGAPPAGAPALRFVAPAELAALPLSKVDRLVAALPPAPPAPTPG